METAAQACRTQCQRALSDRALVRMGEDQGENIKMASDIRSTNCMRVTREELGSPHNSLAWLQYMHHSSHKQCNDNTMYTYGANSDYSIRYMTLHI